MVQRTHRIHDHRGVRNLHETFEDFNRLMLGARVSRRENSHIIIRNFCFIPRPLIIVEDRDYFDLQKSIKFKGFPNLKRFFLQTNWVFSNVKYCQLQITIILRDGWTYRAREFFPLRASHMRLFSLDLQKL